MKYYIKVENDIIKDILSFEYEDYLEIDIDLYRYKYALHSGCYNYINGEISLNKELELKMLEDLKEVELNA